MELEIYEIVFYVLMICLGLGFIIAVFVDNFKHEAERRKKFYGETDHLQAEEFSKKLKDSRVEMGLRKPKSFTTKRKPQKRA